ncbi:MAG: DNA polymerase III subunit delta, partial [Desulfotomaculaceae bacterium]
MNYYIELLNSIKRGVVNQVYLFYGEETYLREQAVTRFKEYYFPDRAQDLNFDLVDGETTSPADIVARAETLPLFAQKRLVVVKNPTFFKPAKKAGKEDSADGEETAGPVKEAALLEYFNNPLDSTCLIFTTGDPVDKRKRLFKAIKKTGRVVEFTLLSRNDLTRWLAQKARTSGRKFAPGAAETLLDTVGTSLQKLSVELEKLINYTTGQEVITPAEVRKICPPGLEENIFAVVDAVGNKRCGEALAAIKEMLAAKEPPFRLLAMVA